MNTIEAETIGKVGIIQFGNLQFRVMILDVKNSYGKTRYWLEPENGHGREWKDAKSVRFIEPAIDNGTG